MSSSTKNDAEKKENSFKRDESKLCVDCVHLFRGSFNNFCARTGTIGKDLVTGEVCLYGDIEKCFDERNYLSEERCNPSGKFYERKAV